MLSLARERVVAMGSETAFRSKANFMWRKKQENLCVELKNMKNFAWIQ